MNSDWIILDTNIVTCPVALKGKRKEDVRVSEKVTEYDLAEGGRANLERS